MKKIMNVEEIMAAIPNRFPIYYLDAVTEFEDEKHITAMKIFSKDISQVNQSCPAH